MRVLGAVLAGGRARRFGRDKAMAELHGRPMLLHVADRLAPRVAARVVSGRSAPLAGLPAVEDHPAPGLGPLGGLCGALRHAEAHGFDAVLCAPCDMPTLPEEALRALLAAGGPAYLLDAPVVGLWPAACFRPLADLLGREGAQPVRRWAELAGARAVETAEPTPNVNTPDDLARLAERGG